MLFSKKRRDKLQDSRLSNSIRTLDGYTAAGEIEAITDEVVGIEPHLGDYANGNRAFSEKSFTILTKNSLGVVTGAAMAGCRAGSIIGNGDYRDDFKVAVAQRLPLVAHLICTQSAGHAAYHDIADLGCFQLFASNVQEVADFALIARRIAELALTPGLCAQDCYTSNSLQPITMPAPQMATTYLGANEAFATPTPSQKMLFGDKRIHVPAWYDVDRPATLGSSGNGNWGARVDSARKIFFYPHVVGIAEQAFKEFAAISGRHYARICGYHLEDAEYVIVAQGAIIENLRALVDVLRQRKKIKAGIVNISMLQPFPGEALAKLLQGKKAVTILENVAASVNDDLPLLQLTRCAMDKSMENGAVRGALPHPQYPTYKKLTERPQLISGIYGLNGENPRLADLEAVFANMQANSRRQFFYVGENWPAPANRFPKLQIVHQNVQKDYAQVSQLLLAGKAPLCEFPEKLTTVRAFFNDRQSGRQTGNLLALALADGLKWQVKTAVQANGATLPLAYTIAMSPQDFLSRSIPDVVDVVVLSSATLHADPRTIDNIAAQGTVIIDADQPGEKLWQKLPVTVKRTLSDRQVNCYHVNTREYATAEKAAPNHIWCGAVLEVLGLENSQLEAIQSSYRTGLEEHLAIPEVEQFMNAVAQGRQLAELKIGDQEGQSEPVEPETPWALAGTPNDDNTVLSLNRFWNCEGYFHSSGRRDCLATDPYVGTATIPARSGCFRDLSPQRSHIPQLIVENCTGCGMCWATCPDSAIPGGVFDLATLLQTAVQQCKDNGVEIANLARLEKHLVQQAYRNIARDGLHEYRLLGTLFQSAFDSLLEKMKPDAQQQEVLTEEFQQLYQQIQHFPIVKSDQFFTLADKEQKGSGALLSLIVNPLSCKGCMQCVAVCPENALEPVVQTNVGLDIYRHNWNFFNKLPVQNELLQKHIRSDAPETAIYHLLNKNAYLSLVGGDNAVAGSGEKTAIHLVTAAVEATMQPRVAQFVQHLTQLIGNMEDKLRDMLHSSLEIRDWEGFAQSVNEVNRQNIDAKILADLLQKSGNRTQLQKDRIERMTMVVDKLRDLAHLYQKGISGRGRANMTMIADKDCMYWAQYPYTPYAFPCASHPNPAKAALGAFAANMRKMAKDFQWVRMAELELEDAYNPQIHDSFFADFDYRRFSDVENGLCPPLLVVADSRNVDWNGIFALIARRLPVKVVILEDFADEALINMRHQEHMAHIEPGLFFLMQQNAFVLQSSPSHPDHLLAGIIEGLQVNAPAVFYLYAPCPQSVGISAQHTIAHTKLAVDSRVFPLWKYNPELEPPLSLAGNPSVVTPLLTPAHWAIKEKNWRNNWRAIPQSQWSSKMKPLADYIALSPRERQEAVPFIASPFPEQKHMRLQLSAAMVHFCETRWKMWQFLQELNACFPSKVEVSAVPVAGDWETREQELRGEYSAKMEQLENEHAAIYQQRLKDTLLSFCGDGAALRMTLKDYITQIGE